MSLKEEFIKWLYINANKNISNLKEETISKDIEDSNQYFDKDILDVNESNFREMWDYLKEELYNKNIAFRNYSASVQSGRPGAILGKKNYLKFLEEKYGETPKKNVNYWIFQGSPEIYDIQEALRAGHLKSWKVAAHKDRIQPGDKVILWQTGSNAGCYALAEVVSEVGEIVKENDNEKQYYKSLNEAHSSQRVQIKIAKNLVDNPVLWEEIKELPEFKNFKAGNQGTNFSATKDQFNKLMGMNNNNGALEEEFLKVIGKFTKEDLEFFYFGLDRIIGALEIKSGDKRVNFSFNPRRLNLVIGQRYCWRMITSRKGIKWATISLQKINEHSTPFGGNPPQPYYTSTDETELIRNSLSDIIDASKKELERSTKSSYESNHPVFERTVYDQDYREQLIGISRRDNYKENAVSNNLPLNQILYGPPGTGKTYKLQNEFFDKFTVSEASLTKSQYLENIVSELTWWQVLSVVLLDLKKAKVNTIIEHDVLIAKNKLSNSKSVRPIIWSSLQSHTSLDCPNVGVVERSDPKIFFKDDKSFWSVSGEELEQYYPEALSILKEINDYKPSPERYVRNYEFVTFHQSFSYEDFVEGIKPKMEEQDKDVSYEIQDGIFKKLCYKAKADPENQYAIFIDEINRGNVSSIFGELITLIEDDKRIGEENELTVKLPYSKKEFGIPSNLHVIGTMNTADRSVEALDTALRRRFTFEEIIPLPHLLSNISFNGFKLDEVLETINNRIEVLLDRDHCIGHSYFIKISEGDTEVLEQTFQNKIIPLLQEYFYHDYEKIALILGEGFVELKEEEVKFAIFKNLEAPEFIASYELKKDILDIEAAVRKLLNHKDEETE